jgi:translocator protein
MNGWYSTLSRPALTPPDWVFAPVWTVLYIMIAVSTAMYYFSPIKHRLTLTTAVLAVHLLTNFAWTYIFFSLQSPGLALADFILLDLSLLPVVVSFWKANRLSGVLLLPYALWVIFATYLNYGFYRLN